MIRFLIGRQQHYTLTHAFFTHLESIAPSLDSVLAMRDHQTYKTFEKRWQLPVYFQLRWKEIVTGLEEAMAGAEREKERNGGVEGVGEFKSRSFSSRVLSC